MDSTKEKHPNSEGKNTVEAQSRLTVNQVLLAWGFDPKPGGDDVPFGDIEITEEDRAEMLQICEEAKRDIYSQAAWAARHDPMEKVYNRMLFFLGVILVLAILLEFYP